MKKLIAIVALLSVAMLGSASKCGGEDDSPVNQGRIIEKNHYLAGETRECKKEAADGGSCDLGDPVTFPERCTFLIEEWETKRRQEVEVACDISFRDAVIGQSWVRPTDPYKRGLAA